MRNDLHPELTADSDRLTSVDNALWLLQLVTERQALRVSEAADLLGVARSTAHRLLSALRRRDFLMQDKPNGVYRPGPALHAIGMAAISGLDVRRVGGGGVAAPCAAPPKTGETSGLAVLEGTMIRYVECYEGLSPVRIGNQAGAVRYAHVTAVGKAMLAAMPDIEVERRYPGEELPAATSASIISRRELLAELNQVRRQGYALNWEESSEGVAAIAAVLCDPVGVPVGSVSVAVPSARLGSIAGLRALVPDILDAAEQISARLRGPV